MPTLRDLAWAIVTIAAALLAAWLWPVARSEAAIHSPAQPEPALRATGAGANPPTMPRAKGARPAST